MVEMSASDKARYYLEQLVPELREFKKKKIFTEVGTLRAEHWMKGY